MHRTCSKWFYRASLPAIWSVDHHVLVTAVMQTCLHCGSPIPSARLGTDQASTFCCHGCKTVHALLHDDGLAYYYQLRKDGGVLRPDELQPAPINNQSVFEDPDFCSRQVTVSPNGQHRCRLYVAGLHCAACVWLLEKTPGMVEGLNQARVHFGRNAIDLQFDPKRCSLASITQCINRLGYQAHPWNGAQAEQRAQQERRHWAMRLPWPVQQ